MPALGFVGLGVMGGRMVKRLLAVEALLRSVVASPMLMYRWPFVLEMPAEGWFGVAMMQKGLELALELGRRLAVALPATALAQEMLTAARGRGLAGYDFAVVFDVLAELSGLRPSAKAMPVGSP